MATRSYLFKPLFYVWTAIVIFGYLPLTPFASRYDLLWLAGLWQRGGLFLLRHVAGVKVAFEGLDRIPQTPVVFAAKHLSAFDTVFINTVRPLTASGMKEELTKIPVFGWYLAHTNIAIDRKGAARAMRSLINGAKTAAAQGVSVLIFPEGTRMPLCAPPDYKSGVAALYRELGLPVVPVALDSGLLWERSGAVKGPGTITVRFLEPIPPGLERKVFMALLQERIETETAALLADEETVPAALPHT